MSVPLRKESGIGMLNRLLPDIVTYYRAVWEGDSCKFERRVLCPVRMQTERIEKDGFCLENGTLYVFPGEIAGEVIHADVGDYFVRGVCEAETPPRDKGTFLVRAVSPMMGIDSLKFLRIDAVGNGGACTDA